MATTELVQKEDGVYVVTPPCQHCGNKAAILLTPDEIVAYRHWKAGEYVQRAFPYWTPDQRELLVSGTHAHCWEAMFGGLDEEDDDESDVPGVS
jgi:hypothetical protein